MSNEYHVYYEPGSRLANEAGTFLFYGFLGFLVWLSQGSVWWTFLFGTIALLALMARIKLLYDKAHRKFNTKAELVAYVATLPE
jgi:hypothetical protein